MSAPDAGRGDGASPADVVVLGAGVVGTAAALRLAEHGASVLVVDADLTGRATAAGAGIVTPIGVGVDPQPDLTAAAVAHYPVLAATLLDDGLDTGYDQVGLLMLPDAGSGDELAGIEQRAATAGVTVERTSTPAGSWPELGDTAADAVYVPAAARVDGRALRSALAGAASRRGARFVTGTARLHRHEDRVEVTVDGAPVGAGQILVATGAWSGQVLASLGGPPVTHPDRGQIVHLRVDGDTGSRPMLQSVHGHYVLGFPDGRVVAGATHEPEAGFDYRVTAGGQTGVLGRTLRLVPGLAAASLVETRVGFRPASHTGRPVVGSWPGVANLTVATGMGSVGLTLGPLLGRLAADQIAGTSSPLLSPLAPATGR